MDSEPDYRNPNDPTPRETEERCREIRERWSEHTKATRWHGPRRQEWLPPMVRQDDLLDAAQQKTP